MENTPVEKSGMGAGILSTMRQIGSVMGLSVLAAILQNRLVTNISGALASLPQIPKAIRDQITEGLQSGNISLVGTNIPGNLSPALQQQLTELFKTQFAASLDATMKIGIIVIILGTVASLFITSHIRRSKKPIEPPV
jgi:hypothetical protein